MREIKFRAWDEKNKRLRSVEDFRFGDGRLYEVVTEGGYAYFEGDGLSLLTIEQFTGLLDKNGKEIYEGDIVRRFAGKYEVRFFSKVGSSYGPGFYGYHPTGDDGDDVMVTLYKDFEVIGNIHSSPELLKP